MCFESTSKLLKLEIRFNHLQLIIVDANQQFLIHIKHLNND